MSPTTHPSATPPARTRSDRSTEPTRLETLLRRACAAAGPEREELYEAAIIAGVPLARTLARPYRGRGVDSEDLEQVALEYLVKAVRNYRPTEDSDFRSYAVP